MDVLTPHQEQPIHHLQSFLLTVMPMTFPGVQKTMARCDILVVIIFTLLKLICDQMLLSRKSKERPLREEPGRVEKG